MKINIWHGLKHDDFAVTEIEGKTPQIAADQIFDRGHLTLENGNVIPWHNITYIEKAEE